MAACIMPVSVSASTWIEGVQTTTSDSNADTKPDSVEVTVVVANDNLLAGTRSIAVEAKLFPPGKTAYTASRDFIDSEKLSDNNPPLGGHVSYVLHLTTTAASGIGSYTVLIDEVDNDAAGDHRTNTTRSVTLYQLDLTSPVLLSVDRADKVVGLGRQVTYTFTISNRGPALDNYSVAVQTPPMEWLASSNKASVPVSAYSNGTFAVTVTAPANQALVAPSICLDIIIQSQATTATWKNTIGAALGIADLWTSSADFSLSVADPEAGQSIELRARVYNDGPVEAKNVVVEFSVSGTTLGSVIIPKIDAGGASELANLKWTAEPGSCRLAISVDPDDTIADINHDNNIAFVQFVVRAPDLTIDTADISTSPAKFQAGDDAIITAIVHNDGKANASHVLVKMTIESFVKSQVIDMITRDGGTGNLTFIWTASPGEHNISIFIDPNNEIGEIDKMNNRAVKNLWVNEYPTAALNASSTKARVGDDITFSAAGSRDPDGRITGYLFDFGDGTSPNWSSSKTASHAYAKSGAYTAKLRVRDNNGTESPDVTWTVFISKKAEPSNQPGFEPLLALGAIGIAAALLAGRKNIGEK